MDYEERGLGSRTLEEVVLGAMGDSVTPSRLLNSKKPGFLERLFGGPELAGPFTAELMEDEQPHYVFRTENNLTIRMPDNSELQGKWVQVAVITDERSIFYYIDEDGNREIVKIPHANLISLDTEDVFGANRLKLSEGQGHELVFEMWTGDPYSSELMDAAAYIYDKAKIGGGFNAERFDSGDYTTVGEKLAHQFDRIQHLGERINIRNVVETAVTGASIGRRAGPKGAGLGFLLGAGYSIWSDLTGNDAEGTDLEDINPEQAAKDIIRWQKAGEKYGPKGVELASGAIGAAIAIDKQTTGRDLSRQLSEMDIDWVSRQLADGNTTEAGLEVASVALEAYSSSLADLLNDDFFEELTGANKAGRID